MIEQIEFDAATSAYTSTSLNHTGASDISLVVCGAFLNGSPAFTATYGGVAMTSTQTLLDVNQGRRATVFYLENPPTGTQSFVVNAAITSGFFWVMTFKKASYLDPTDRSFDYSAVNVNSIQVGLTPLSRKCWLICWAETSNSNTSYSIDVGTQRKTTNSGSNWNTINTLEVANLTPTTFTATSNPTYDGIQHIIGVEIHPKNSRGLMLD